MSSNNDNSGAGMGIAIVLAGLYFLAILAYALACFIACIFTVLAIIAWEKPLRLFGTTICHPVEARVFFAGGIAGAIAVPAFAFFCAVLFDKHIPDAWWFYMLTGGYSFGSLLAIGKLAEKYPHGFPSKPEGPVIEHIPTPAPVLPAPPPFRYASWDDEAEQTATDNDRCAGCSRRDDPSKVILRL